MFLVEKKENKVSVHFLQYIKKKKKKATTKMHKGQGTSLSRPQYACG
jgi:hypothetical protein